MKRQALKISFNKSLPSSAMSLVMRSRKPEIILKVMINYEN